MLKTTESDMVARRKNPIKALLEDSLTLSEVIELRQVLASKTQDVPSDWFGMARQMLDLSVHPIVNPFGEQNWLAVFPWYFVAKKNDEESACLIEFVVNQLEFAEADQKELLVNWTADALLVLGQGVRTIPSTGDFILQALELAQNDYSEVHADLVEKVGIVATWLAKTARPESIIEDLQKIGSPLENRSQLLLKENRGAINAELLSLSKRLSALDIIIAALRTM